jgi:hypothetical protein
MDKRYQVFVSSTYTDLKEERWKAIQAVIELDCIAAGMELFPPSEKPCECVAEFKVISSKENSKEFANYVTSFEHGKVPVIYQVWYNADGFVSRAQFLKLGNRTRDKLHPNDGLLGVKIKSPIGGPGQSQSTKINSPGDCFPENKR